jgi:hypothetical protein
MSHDQQELAMSSNEECTQPSVPDLTDFERLAVLERRFNGLVQEVRELLQEWHFECTGGLSAPTNPAILAATLQRLVLASTGDQAKGRALGAFTGPRPRSVRTPVFGDFAKS